MNSGDASKGYGRRELLLAGLAATPVVAAALIRTPDSAAADGTDRGYSVLDFGAGPDQTGEQNAKAFQLAVDAAAKVGGGTVDFSDSVLRFDGTLVFAPRVNARGSGSIVFTPTAKWLFGNGTTTRTFQSQVYGIRFLRAMGSETGASIPDGSLFIEIDRCRELSIHDCFFYGADKAILHTANAATASHDNSMIAVSNNQFGEVNYAWYVDRDAAAPWGASADSTFSGNIVNRAYVTHVHCEAIDGVTITGNTLFFLGHSSSNDRFSEKKNNIYIGESNWVHIHNNNCFEAGEEAIKLSDAQTVSVTSNNIAWPGQNQPSDGIHIVGRSGRSNLQGVVIGNVISSYTRHGVYAGGPTQAFRVGQNAASYVQSTSTYRGSAALAETAHHRYYFADSMGVMPLVEDGFSPRPGEGDRYPGIAGPGLQTYERLGELSGLAGATTKVTFAEAGGGQDVFACQDMDRGSLEFGGIVVITAKRVPVAPKKAGTQAAKSANYVLLISKNSAGAASDAATRTVTVMGEAGLLSGATADEPAFRWGFNGDNLHATPRDATSGDFSFFGIAIGNLLLS